MKDYGYNRNNAAKDFETLPKGGYVLKILNTKYEEGQNGNSDRLRLQVDICEGEYKDYYKKQFEADTREDKKWRGVVEIWCPKNDGSEKDGWTKKTFDTCFAAIEDSNPGFRFDGVHENTLIGKIVGGVIYQEDYEKDGQIKTAFKFNKRLITADSARQGTYKVPNDKIIQKKDTGVEGSNYVAPVNNDSLDSELPF